MSLYVTEEKQIDCNRYEKNSQEIPCQLCILCLNTESDKVAGKVTSGMIASLKRVKTSRWETSPAQTAFLGA